MVGTGTTVEPDACGNSPITQALHCQACGPKFHTSWWIDIRYFCYHVQLMLWQLFAPRCKSRIRKQESKGFLPSNYPPKTFIPWIAATKAGNSSRAIGWSTWLLFFWKTNIFQSGIKCHGKTHILPSLGIEHWTGCQKHRCKTRLQPTVLGFILTPIVFHKCELVNRSDRRKRCVCFWPENMLAIFCEKYENIFQFWHCPNAKKRK